MICKNENWYQWAVNHYRNECIILDTETTGGTNSDIIDIALVHFPTGKVLFDSLVYSAKEINYFAQKIHNIQSYQLRTAPDLSFVWKQIKNYLADYPVLAYNTSFDKNILYKNLSYKKIDFEESSYQWECVMQAFEGYSGKKMALTKACELMKVKSGNHRAKEDALATARLLYRMSQKY